MGSVAPSLSVIVELAGAADEAMIEPALCQSAVDGLHVGVEVRRRLAGDCCGIDEPVDHPNPTARDEARAALADERHPTDQGANGAALRTGQPQRVNQLRIATNSHDEQTRKTVADAVNKNLTDAGVEVKSAASISRSEAISEGHLGPIILILLGIALPLGVVGIIGLASTMSANVLDRTREFGVMHAIGALPKAVRRIVAAEGILLALASCLLAILPTLGLTAVLGAGLGNLFFSAPLPFRISLLAAGIWTTLVILGAVLATEAAATRAARLTVREALSYQ